MRPLILGTRGSLLAKTQAEFVRQQWLSVDPSLKIDIQIIQTKADRLSEEPLHALPGEGVFVKELETALLSHEIDFAVHSLKDVPVAVTPGLSFPAIMKRHDARDAVVGPFKELAAIPAGSVIGTSSLRRQSQLLAVRPDLNMKDIRGNVDTRLRKLDEGHYDAIVLAAAGLIRLGLQKRIAFLLEPETMLPEPGQGALAIQARADDHALCQSLDSLNDVDTQNSVAAERAFLEDLGGGCRVPIAALATCHDGRLEMDGAVVAQDGSQTLRHQLQGSSDDAVAMGRQLAKQLIDQGALALLNA